MRVAAVIFTQPPQTDAFAEACLQFSPTLCTKRPGWILIEIGSCHRLYDEPTFLERMHALLATFGLSARTVVGDSLLSTLLLGQYGTHAIDRLPIESFTEFIDPFKADAGLAPAVEHMIDSLRQVGVVHVSDFLNIPLAELSARFGAIAVFLHSRITGEFSVPWPLWVPEEKVAELIELDEAEHFSDVDSLVHFIQPILDRIFARLLGRGLCAASLKIALKLEKLSFVKERTREWRIEFMFPQTNSEGAIPILRERLSRDLDRRPIEALVEQVEVEVLQTNRSQRNQTAIFNSGDESRELFDSAFAHLAEGLGQGKVFRAMVLEEAVPEKSWNKTIQPQNDAPDLSDYVPPRPTRLLLHPEPVHIVRDKVFIRGKPYNILKWSSVEQIATHWLEGEIVRSYYRLTLSDKPPIWVFKTPQDEYFLHGYFG